MRTALATIAVLLALTASASASTRAGTVQDYAQGFGAYQGWVIAGITRKGGNNARARYVIKYLGNPEPRAANCFGDYVITGDGPTDCPEKAWQDDGPFWMNVDAVVEKCSTGVYAISAPGEHDTCPMVLPAW